MGDYHRHLAKRRPSAAEVAETKRRMGLGSRVAELETVAGELEQSTTDMAEYLGEMDGLPQDDGVPPAAPTNVVVTPVP